MQRKNLSAVMVFVDFCKAFDSISHRCMFAILKAYGTEYFPKSINTKAKNDQDKSYSDRTNKQTNKQIERQTLRIIISTRASVVPVPSPIMIKSHIMTKNQYPSLD